MKIYVDADACPVKEEIVKISMKYGIEAVFVFSISHSGNLRLAEGYGNVEIIMVDNVSQAADMAIINRVTSGDVVVTGDYGLASIIISKKAAAISFGGSLFNADNIDKLLFERHISSVIRRGGGKIKGPSKRSKDDDCNFKDALESVILKKMKDI